MTRFVVFVVLVILLYTVEGNPTCSGCLVDGDCLISGHKEMINGKMCTCDENTWTCTELAKRPGQEVVTTTANPCAGCATLDGRCYKKGDMYDYDPQCVCDGLFFMCG